MCSINKHGIIFVVFMMDKVKVKLILKVMKRNSLVIAVVFGLLGWSCSKVDTSQQLSLKQSIDKNVADINTALSKILQQKVIRFFL